MLTKELPIQQSKEWEIYGDKIAYNSDEFKTELHKYGVRDLFDKQLAIKQDKEKYIFAINGENKFAVNSKVDFTTFIQDFYKDLAETKKRAEQKKAVISVSEFEKKTRIEITITETAKDLAELSDQIKKNEKLAEKATDILNVKYKVNRLITFFQQEKDLTNENIWWFLGRQYDRKDRGLRKINKTEIKWRLEELSKIQDQIEKLEKNKNKKDSGVKMDDVNEMDMKMTLKQFSDRIEDLGKEAPDFILARNQIILGQADTVPYFEIMGYSKSDAKKINTSLKRVNNEYAILDELKLTGAKRQELSQDLQDMEEYLNNVINNRIKPSEHPFVPTHTKDFYALMNIKPTPEQLKQLNKEADKAPETSTSTTGGVWTWAEINKKWAEYSASPYSNTKEAFEKWGIGGMIKYGLDQTKMRPEQKQFWWGVGNLAITGGVIFLGWKMLSSAFKMVFKSSKEKKTGVYDTSNRARLGIPTALIIWSHARTGEWPMSIFKWGKLTEKIAGIFPGGSKVETENQTSQDKETHTKYVEWFQGAMAIFNGLNYGEMKQFLIQDGDKMKIDPNKYDTLLEIFKNGSKKNEAAAAFLESIGKNDEKHVLNLGLTGMGVKREQMEDDTNKDKKFNTNASDTIIRLCLVNGFMEKNWYNKINSETQYMVDNYIANWRKDTDELDELVKRGDVFYKELNFVDQTGLSPKIKELANGDPKKEEEILLAINSFYNQMPNAEKKIELSGTRPEITFKTYEQTTTINISNKEIVWFTPNRFSSYLETFKAANLTNRIKFLCKDKEAKSDKPFYLSPVGRDITFDNAKIFSPDFDTEIMTAWWGWNLKKVSPTLDAYKQEYCDYLNTLKFWKKKLAA